jgi:hypothetical protein
MRNCVLTVLLAALPVLSVADQLRDVRPTTPHVVKRPSQERLDQIRRSLMAQIAVRDAEGIRAPTGAEAAALSGVASEKVQTVALPGGGVALLTNGAQLSMVVASRSEDGTMRITHGAMPATTSRDDAKGGSHVR